MARYNGLTKYDAPLKIQYQWGYDAFLKGYTSVKLDRHTMQYREYQRGYNDAYFANLKQVQHNEEARARV
tara:strand:+ start:1487 stop:1696 length:210 start_codon:yes stop_codon:yes gene_type:complete